MSTEIVVVGEALIDLIEQPDGLFHAKTGGAPANVSISLARLGTDVTFVARMSTDAFGEKLHSWLQSESINLTHLARTSDPTTLAVATLDGTGKASYSFYIDGTADWGLSSDDLSFVETTPPMAFVMGSVALAISPSSTSIETVAQNLHASAATTVVTDLNIRPGLGFDSVSERVRIERQIKSAHIIKASDDDIAWLFDTDKTDEIDEIARSWSTGQRVVIITRGSKGASVFTENLGALDVVAPEITLVDTVGAGDAFLGATIFGLQQRNALGMDPVTRLQALTESDWLAVLSLATRVGAITCTRAGCNPPNRGELGIPSTSALA